MCLSNLMYCLDKMLTNIIVTSFSSEFVMCLYLLWVTLQLSYGLHYKQYSFFAWYHLLMLPTS